MPKKRVKKPPVKARKRKTVENDETCLQMHCFAWVKKAHPKLLIFHVANERQAHVQLHLKLKRMGVLAGVADFLAFPIDGRKVAIEMKDDEGKQDDDQARFQKRWERGGGLYFICRTVTDFQAIINALIIFG